MKDKQRLQMERVIKVATTCEILIQEIDALEANGIKFRHLLKKNAKGLRNECLKLNEWFWEVITENGDEAQMEVFKLQSALETIGTLIVDFPTTALDEIQNFIKTKKDLIKR